MTILQISNTFLERLISEAKETPEKFKDFFIENIRLIVPRLPTQLIPLVITAIHTGSLATKIYSYLNQPGNSSKATSQILKDITALFLKDIADTALSSLTDSAKETIKYSATLTRCRTF